MPDHPADPSLLAFVRAAAQGGRVWAWREDDHIAAGCQGPHGKAQTAELLTEVLREVFGRSAGDLARRALLEAARTSPDGGLPAALVRRVIDDAEAARSLLQGAAFGLRLRYSAVACGAGYKAVCTSLGIDPLALPAERRSELDEALRLQLALEPDTDEGRLASLLHSLLTRPLH